MALKKHLVSDKVSGDTYVIADDWSGMTDALHYSDWQTQDALDEEKVEAATWNLDNEVPADFSAWDYFWLHTWND